MKRNDNSLLLFYPSAFIQLLILISNLIYFSYLYQNMNLYYNKYFATFIMQNFITYFHNFPLLFATYKITIKL